MIQTKHLQATLDTSSGVLYQVRYKPNMKSIGIFLQDVDAQWYYHPEKEGRMFRWWVLKELGEMLEELNVRDITNES